MSDKLAESTEFGTNIPVDGWFTSPANTESKVATKIQTRSASHVLVGTRTCSQNLYKTNSMVWVRERTITTERPPLVSEVIANFGG
jgi:hypothetical protein